MAHIILTGATGLAGSEALRVALAHPLIHKVTVLPRRPLPASPATSSPKLTVITHKDFNVYEPELLERLEGADGVLWDLGISAVGMKEREYEIITLDYAVAAAKAFSTIKRDRSKPKFVFAYLSGDGTKQDESSWQLFSRIKGRAEVALSSLRATHPSLATYSFRPRAIQPVSPLPSPSFFQRTAFKTLFPLLGVVAPQYLIKTDVLAKGMIEVVLKGGSGEVEGWEGKGALGDERVFGNEEIKKLAEGKGRA